MVRKHTPQISNSSCDHDLNGCIRSLFLRYCQHRHGYRTDQHWNALCICPGLHWHSHLSYARTSAPAEVPRAIGTAYTAAGNSYVHISDGWPAIRDLDPFHRLAVYRTGYLLFLRSALQPLGGVNLTNLCDAKRGLIESNGTRVILLDLGIPIVVSIS